MSAIVAGTAWVVNQADWQISKPEQIRIEGNQYLSEATIRSMLAIPYPQQIIALSPDQLRTQLIAKTSIADARIDRRLLPPRVTVQIRDTPPVAGIMEDETTDPQIFIDERGLQLPISSYRSAISQSPPRLRLRLPIQGLCPNWSQIYRSINISPVAIGIIDCRNPQNLIFQTELGTVRIGVVSDKNRLNAQIQQLDRLRDWQKHTNPTDVEYLDLENPSKPRFQLKRPLQTLPQPKLE
jgi:cell division protein FtsQ